MGFCEFRRQLEYKAKRNGAELVPWGRGDVSAVRRTTGRSTGRRICVGTHSIGRVGPASTPRERKALALVWKTSVRPASRRDQLCPICAWIEQRNVCCRTLFRGVEGLFSFVGYFNPLDSIEIQKTVPALRLCASYAVRTWI
jgi:hypothetical protein